MAAKIASLDTFSTGRKRASRNQSGWDFSPTSVSKNMKATMAINKPRAAPNNRPSVRSNVPMAESRIRSDNLVVISETKIRVSRNTEAIAAASASFGLGIIGVR